MSRPGDRLEKEADAKAARVARGGSSETGPRCSCGGECTTCRARASPQAGLQAKALPGSDSVPAGAPASVSWALASPGRPLDGATLRFMEPRFGREFGDVRVHTGPEAEEAAAVIHARAFTLGDHMVFGRGALAPGSSSGRELIAHELAHVVQQAEGSPAARAAIQRQSAGDVEARAGEIGSSLSEADRAALRRYLELVRAGRVGAEDNARVFEAMAGLREALRRQAQVSGEGAGSKRWRDSALQQSGAGFAVAGGLLVDDLTGFGIADDPGIPPAVIYGLGALVVAGAAAATYAAFAPSEEELERTGEAVGKATQDLLWRIAEAGRRARPETEPTPKPKPGPQRGPEPTTDIFPPVSQPRNPREECQMANPGALACEDWRDRDEVVVEFLMSQGYSHEDLGDCRGLGSFGPGVIDACAGAPGEIWHCRVNGTTSEVSVFGCVCCHEDGSSSHEWRGAHWSENLTGR